MATRNKLLKPDSTLITRLLNDESDDRYKYLVRNSTLHFIEQDSGTIFCELKQIPQVMIVYRRPGERVKNAERISLDDRQLARVPLLEGEERLKYLNLSGNNICKIENLVSLPSLSFLDLSCNKIREIVPQPVVRTLKVLLLAQNQIDEIKNLEFLPNLEVLDLHDNQIRELNLKFLEKIKVINLSGNLIRRFEVTCPMPNLVELNLRKNIIDEVGDLRNLSQIKKLYLSGNKVASIDHVAPLQTLTDLTLEGNPIDKCTDLSTILREKFPSLASYNLQRFQEGGSALESLANKLTDSKRQRTPADSVSVSKEPLKEPSKEHQAITGMESFPGLG